MIALSTIVIFFFVLVIVYPAAVSLVVLVGWVKKRRLGRNSAGGAKIARIDEATDRMKSRLFIISIVVAFFVIAPFLALLMIL